MIRPVPSYCAGRLTRKPPDTATRLRTPRGDAPLYGKAAELFQANRTAVPGGGTLERHWIDGCCQRTELGLGERPPS